jgi:pSer/pThr/pTyr-binding forkhead associated (FHA) protein
VVIGRASVNDVVLNDRRVSRRHCRVERRGESFVLIDGNVFAELMETVKVASLGSISRALYDVGGQYRRSM